MKTDWRKEHTLTDEDPDDDEMGSTPVDVVLVLGFDPKDLDWDESDSKKENEDVHNRARD